MGDSRKITYAIVILLLFATSFCFAEEKKYECDFDFKGFEKTIISQIPSSMVLSQQSDEKNGEIRLEIGKSQPVTLNYRGCFHLGISLKSNHLDRAYLEKFIELAHPIILQTATSGMVDILKKLTPHIADDILKLEISDHYFSTMYIDVSHNEDDTINIEISVSGG